MTREVSKMPIGEQQSTYGVQVAFTRAVSEDQYRSLFMRARQFSRLTIVKPVQHQAQGFFCFRRQVDEFRIISYVASDFSHRQPAISAHHKKSQRTAAVPKAYCNLVRRCYHFQAL